MVTYKGLPPPLISEHLTREESRLLYTQGTEFQIGKIEMVANTGTYLDSPFHRYANGPDLSALTLETLANLDGIVVRHGNFSEAGHAAAGSSDGDSKSRAITTEKLKQLQLRGKAVLFQTGWDRHWRTAEYSSGNHPFLTSEAAEYLAAAGIKLVGIDSYNIDDTADGQRPAHSTLLARNIPIVEHLCNLQSLPDADFRFFAVPVKVKGFGTFPVRAFAMVPDEITQPDY